MQNNENKEKDIYAGFFVRLFAYIIDSFVIAFTLAMPNLIIFFLGLGNNDNFFLRSILFNFSLWDIIQYLLTTAYFVLFTYFSGSTLGKMALRIKVVPNKEEKLSFFDVLFRETIGKYLAALILNLGYLLICVDKEKRGLHDILADTRVIYTCKFKVFQEVKYYNTPIQPVQPMNPQYQQPMNQGMPIQPLNPQFQQPINSGIPVVPPMQVPPVQNSDSEE